MNAAKRSLSIRMRERFRYGLVLQEALDSLYRWFRIIVCPYYLVEEGGDPDSTLEGETPQDCKIRFLGETDLEDLRKISSETPLAARLEASMSRGSCLGLFVDERLAACTWSRTDVIPVPNSGMPLRALGDDEAYLFGAFVSRDYRGRRLAPDLRRAQYRALKEMGRSRLYSVTLAFNQSSRRFKAKLGAREAELRFVIGIANWRSLDIRLRRLTGDAETPAFKWLTLSTPQPRDSVDHEVARPEL